MEKGLDLKTLLLGYFTEEEYRAKIKAKVKIPVSDEEIEKILAEFPGLVEPQIVTLFQTQSDFCTRCGTCCRECHPIDFTKRELKIVADHLKTSYKKLKKKLRIRPLVGESGILAMPAKPCPFLNGENDCSVYAIRPISCKLYPLGKSVVNVAGGTRAFEFPDNCEAVGEMLVFTATMYLVLQMMEQAGLLPEEEKESMRQYALSKMPNIKDALRKVIT